MKIAVDFDGTIVEHKYPEVGREVPGAIEWLKKWRAAGATLILWTMRSGDDMLNALAFCARRALYFDANNEGPGDGVWTTSPKAYAHVYVDDAAFGCPLVESKEMGARPYADWDIIGPAVMEMIEAKQREEGDST